MGLAGRALERHSLALDLEEPARLLLMQGSLQRGFEGGHLGQDVGDALV